MKKFLTKLKQEGTLELVEPSRNISQAYHIKAQNCLRAAKILSKERLYENAVSQGYYAMYNAIQSCLFLSGIKCENHTASILLLNYLFGKSDLQRTIAKAKQERIDKDYYMTGAQNEPITAEIAMRMIKDAEHVITSLQLLKEGLDEKSISKAREKIMKL
jgi:uncharacterized protein (UPF0332 family)